MHRDTLTLHGSASLVKTNYCHRGWKRSVIEVVGEAVRVVILYKYRIA